MKMDWTNRLITALFTAAAAWGSVTVEINRTVNARAELTEQRLARHIDDRVGEAVKELHAHAALMLDSVSANPALVVHVPPAPPLPPLAPVVIPTADSAVLAQFDLTNERLRAVAIAIAKLQAEIRDQVPPVEPQQEPRPKYGGRTPYGG